MSSILGFEPVSGGGTAMMLQGSSASRFAPEPRNSVDFFSTAGKVLSAGTSIAGSALGGVAGLGGVTDIPGLLNKQIEIQMIMQLVSMESNIARSRHETEMAPIRNMRVG